MTCWRVDLEDESGRGYAGRSLMFRSLGGWRDRRWRTLCFSIRIKRRNKKKVRPQRRGDEEEEEGIAELYWISGLNPPGGARKGLGVWLGGVAVRFKRIHSNEFRKDYEHATIYKFEKTWSIYVF